MEKDFIRLIWTNRLFDDRNLQFSDRVGRVVLSIGVVDPVDDFLFHGVEIFNPLSGASIRGSARIDSASGDWEETTNRSNIILHIVGKCDKRILTDRGQMLSLVLTPTAEVLNTASRMAIDCSDYFNSIDAPSRESIKLRLLSERLERKGREVLALKDQIDDWHEVLYICLMRSLGYKERKDELHRLALSLPYRYLMRHSDRAEMVEAIMLGMTGHLDVTEPDEYTSELQKEWNEIKLESPLCESIVSWHETMRHPRSLPALVVVRAVAILIHANDDLVETILACKTADKLHSVLDISLSTYWRFHYAPSLKVEGNSHSPNLSPEKLNLIIINGIAPFLWAMGTKDGKEELIERSIELLDQISAEYNTYTRRWLTDSSSRYTAFDSQAIIELCTVYCSASRCTLCPIGAYRLLQTYRKQQLGSIEV